VSVRSTNGIWQIEDEGGHWLGSVIINDAAAWEWLDEGGSAFAPPARVDLGPWERGLGTDWPSFETLLGQAAALRERGGTMLRAHLGGPPELIPAYCRGLPESTERTARLALLFGQVASEFADVRLRPVQLALERLAYRALAALYEAEPDGSERRPLLRDALKSALRAWQATVANDDRIWFFESKDVQAQGTAQDQADAPSAEAALLRESAMWEILTIETGQGRRLRRLFRESTEGHAAVRRLAERWCLRRCDLAGAEQLKTALRSLARDGPAGGYLDAPPALLVRLARGGERLALLLGLACVAGWLALAVREANPWRDMAQLPVLWLLYLLCGATPALSWLRAGAPDTSAPRLLAGILVALVGVIMQQQWDKLALFADGQPLLAAGLALLIIVAAFRVLLSKVQVTLGALPMKADRPPGSVIKRVCAWWSSAAVLRTRIIWQRGLAVALLLSLLVTDLLGDIYLAEVAGRLIRFPGAVGHIYPGLALLFAALMLFAGVFAQLLWEERPITEGIA